MPRISMVDIIQYVRDLIGDTTATQAFDDDTIQNSCDRRRNEVRLQVLRGVYSVIPGGFVKYLDFYAGQGQWEKNVILQDNTWATITADSSDLQAGKWHFDVEPKWPVYLTGYLYDIYAIAADLCEAWAAKYTLKFDNQSGQFKNARSQQNTHLLRQAKTFRLQARTSSAPMIRDDLTGN